MQTLPERLKRDEWFDGTGVTCYDANFKPFRITLFQYDNGVGFTVEMTETDIYTSSERYPTVKDAYRKALEEAQNTFNYLIGQLTAELATLDAS